MPNTTNFNWSTPADTDLVKNGASAIRTLGSAIDTSFVDFKGGTTGQVLKKTSNTDLDVEWGTVSSGLTLINTTSFSAVASQSVNDVFSSTYSNYVIIGSTSVERIQTLRVRVSGSDNTSSNYKFLRNWYLQTGAPLSSQTTATSFDVNAGGNSTADVSSFNIQIFNPQATAKTRILSWASSDDTGSGYGAGYTETFGYTTVDTSYTGFTAIFGGNATGTIRVYGLAN
jgi:hypothetical protein